MISVALLALALAQTPHVPQPLERGPVLSAEQEQRALKLGKQLRCAVCQGLSITDSPSSMARAQLNTVRSLILEGKSDQEIYDYFTARYGEWALLAPPTEGFNWVVWLGPALVLIFGGGIVFRLVRGGAKPEPAAPVPEETAKPPAEEDDPYLAAVRAELKK